MTEYETIKAELIRETIKLVKKAADLVDELREDVAAGRRKG